MVFINHGCFIAGCVYMCVSGGSGFGMPQWVRSMFMPLLICRAALHDLFVVVFVVS